MYIILNNVICHMFTGEGISLKACGTVARILALILLTPGGGGGGGGRAGGARGGGEAGRAGTEQEELTWSS